MAQKANRGIARTSGYTLRQYGMSYLGLLPFFALFFTFIASPLVRGIAMSFTDW